MGYKTGIEWTDATWNPVRGCSRVSDGCRNCYAETMAARFSDPGQPYHGFTERERTGSKWTGRVELVPAQLDLPMRLKKPRRIFVNSMSDLFHESLSDADIDWVFAVMALAPQHTFQILTKRAERMRRYVEMDRMGYIEGRAKRMLRELSKDPHRPVMVGKTLAGTWPWHHVWLGVSVENAAAANERIPELLQTPATLRFLSCEPLLGPVKLLVAPLFNEPPGRIDWVIAGGESGKGARPMHPEWVRSLRDDCQTAKVPFFFKQWGEWAPDGVNFVDHGSKGIQVGTFSPLATTRGDRASVVAWRKTSVPLGSISEGDQMERMGKRLAGAMLDGREWREFPA